MKLNNKGGSPESERNCHKKEKELRDSDCEYWYQKGLKDAVKEIKKQMRASNKNIKYHDKKTKNPNCRRDWSHIYLGEEFCLDAVQRLNK